MTKIRKLDEITDDKKRSYIDAALADTRKAWHKPLSKEHQTPTGKVKKSWLNSPERAALFNKYSRRREAIQKTSKDVTGKKHFSDMDGQDYNARDPKFKYKNESTQLDELSKKTLKSYISKNFDQRQVLAFKDSGPQDNAKVLKNRLKGAVAARKHIKNGDYERVHEAHKASIPASFFTNLVKNQKNESLDEAVKVVKKDYSWGKMVTIHHGANFSIPLHPEHQKALASLKHGDSTNFTDETRSRWTARRDGDSVHIDNGKGNRVTVNHSHFNESLDEGHTINQVQAAIGHHENKSIAHSSKALHYSRKSLKALEAGDDSSEMSHNSMSDRHDRASRRHDAAAQVARSLLWKMKSARDRNAPPASPPMVPLRTEETVNELSKKTLGRYVKSAYFDGAQHMSDHGKNVINSMDRSNSQDTTLKYSVSARKSLLKAAKRQRGIAKAVDNLTKEETTVSVKDAEVIKGAKKEGKARKRFLKATNGEIVDDSEVSDDKK